jgi:hypothetical protein
MFKSICMMSFTRHVYEYLSKVYGMDFKVPLGVGIKIGERLGEGPEESWNIYKDGREVKVK